jgi:hypothetical protein
MAPKRAGSRSSTTPVAASNGSPPLANALLLGAAVSYGLSLLFMKGRVTWPPHQFLGSLYTVAGCLALVGPLLLWRGESGGRGLGELLWMTGGMLVWVFDAVAAIRGSTRPQAWATPLSYETMGLTMLAVLLAGWRCRAGGRNWAWTNVTGWILGIFWVAMAFSSLLPARLLGSLSR